MALTITDGTASSGSSSSSSTLAETITENAKGPLSVESDGQKVVQHSVRDQIAADQYAKSAEAVADPSRRLSRFQIVPPGAC